MSGQDPNDGPNTIQQWFNTAAFVLQPTGTYGDAVRNSIIGPGIFNFDMSILRNFTLGGSKSLQFRLEAFNTFNQPVWNDPNTSVTSPQYGQITVHAQADARAAAWREVRLLSSQRSSQHEGTEVLPKGRASVLFL